MGGIASRDENFVPTLIGVSSVDLKTPVTAAVDPTTHRVLVDAVSSGPTGAQIAAHFQTDQFTTTNNQTQFTASQATIVENFLVISNGQVLTPGGGYDYTITGNVLTLTQGVPAGLQLLWIYIY